MVPVLHAGTPHRVSLCGFERSHPQLVIREMGSEARASLDLKPQVARVRSPLRTSASARAGAIERRDVRVVRKITSIKYWLAVALDEASRSRG